MSDGTSLDGMLPEHPATRYIFHINEAARKFGRPLAVAHGMADRMAEAGFFDIQQKTVIWQIGSWPKQRDLKQLGRWGKLSLLEGAYPFALILLSREGWPQQDIKKMVDEFVVARLSCSRMVCVSLFDLQRAREAVTNVTAY